MTAAEARAAIRSKKSKILDVKNGARGWIIGPFICLWFSAFDQYGPMLFGLISARNSGSRVHGIAGSDLNGVVMFTLLASMVAPLGPLMVLQGEVPGFQLLPLALTFLVGGPIVYWSAHRERKSAEPLVRFLHRTLKPRTARAKSPSSPASTHDGLSMILNGHALDGPVTPEELDDALLRVGNGDFLVIEAGPQTYMQTACRDGRYVLEMRNGGPYAHYRAVRNSTHQVDGAEPDDTLTYQEVSAAFGSYLTGASLPDSLRFEDMHL